VVNVERRAGSRGIEIPLFRSGTYQLDVRVGRAAAVIPRAELLILIP
jgi:hypothetical protein